MDALERMIKLRGGLEGFNSNPTLQGIITWADFSYATSCSLPPRFPRLPANSKTIFLLTHLSPRTPSSSISFSHILPLTLLDTIGALNVICTAATRTLSFEERKAISKAIYLLEYRLLSINYESHGEMNTFETGEDFIDANLKESFRIAAILFIHLAIRDLTPMVKMNVVLAQKLSESLRVCSYALYNTKDTETFGVERRWGESDRQEIGRKRYLLLAWIAFVGATAMQQNERYFFMGILKTACEEVNVRSAKELQDVLKIVVWSGSFCGRFMNEIWDGVGVLAEITGID